MPSWPSTSGSERACSRRPEKVSLGVGRRWRSRTLPLARASGWARARTGHYIARSSEFPVTSNRVSTLHAAVGGLQLHALEFAIEGLPLDAQDLGGLALVAAGRREHTPDLVFFRVGQCLHGL